MPSEWDDFEKGGYINTNHVKFQVGRRLYDAQVLHADVEAKKEITPERIKEICINYCELVTVIGQIRADYDRLKDIIEKTTEKLKNSYRDLKSTIKKELCVLCEIRDREKDGGMLCQKCRNYAESLRG